MQPKKVLHFFLGFVDAGLGSLAGLATVGLGCAGWLGLVVG